jgi:hypothetical protein
MKPILFVFLLCIGLAFAAPSDLIKHSSGPTKIDLNNADPSSAKAIDKTNENLTAAKRHEMEDLGPHFSGAREPTFTLGDMGLTVNQISFSEKVEAVPSSVGNATKSALLSRNVTMGNMTIINGTTAWF